MIFINKFFEQKYSLCFEIFCFIFQINDYQSFKKYKKNNLTFSFIQKNAICLAPLSILSTLGGKRGNRFPFFA